MSKKHFIGATYDLTQEHMNGLIEQLEELKFELEATEKVYRMNREYVETAKRELKIYKDATEMHVNKLNEQLKIAVYALESIRNESIFKLDAGWVDGFEVNIKQADEALKQIYELE